MRNLNGFLWEGGTGWSLHLYEKQKVASQHWTVMVQDQEVMNRIASLGCSGTSSTCRFCDTEDKQWGVERSPVSVVYS